MNQTEPDNPAGDTSARRTRLFASSALVDRRLLSTLGDAFHHGWFVVAFPVLLGVLLAIYQVHREPTVYDANAEILLQPLEATQLTLVYSGSAKRAVVSLPTEAQILTSDTLLGRVARDLDLANDPRFSSFARAGYHYDASQPEVRAAMIAKLRDGLSVRYDVFKSDEEPDGSDIAGTGGRTKKSNQASGPRVMYLTFTGINPELAAAILKTEIGVYVDRNFELRHDAIMRVSTHLKSSMEDFKRKVESEQRGLFALQQRNGSIGLAGAVNPDEVELVQLGRADTLAKAQVRASQAENKVVIEGGSSAPDLRLAYTTDDVALLREALNFVELQLAEMESTLGPGHPSVRELQARKEQLERELSTAQSRIARQVTADLEFARSEAGLLESEIRTKASKVRRQQLAAADATTLQVQLARDSELYYVLVNNVRTAEIDAGFGSIAVDILKQPYVPDRPRRKNYVVRTLLYGFAGFAVGLGVAFWIVSLANASRISDWQIERMLGMNCLAEIPWTDQAPKSDSSGPLVLSHPGSDFAHAMDAFRDMLLLLPASSSITRLVFTGGSRGHGTTTVAVNAAVALAKTGASVLLIDADWHNPSIHRRLRLDGIVGLGDVLREEVCIEDAVTRFPGIPGLDVLAMGSGRLNEVNTPDRFRQLLERADTMYRFIVLDAGSIQNMPEVETVLSLAELAVLVQRQGELNRREMMQSGITIRESGVRLSGFVRICRKSDRTSAD